MNSKATPAGRSPRSLPSRSTRSATWWITAPSPTPSRSIRRRFATQPFAGILTTPGRFTNVSPRVDYQLGENNTLMFRYGITHSDVRDNGIGGFDLVSRGYHSQFTNQTVQAADTMLLGTAVNETRFQYYRSATQAIANSLQPALSWCCNRSTAAAPRSVAPSTRRTATSCRTTPRACKGAHSWRFGVRLRGQTDDSVSPQNFNGTFTFGGGALGARAGCPEPAGYPSAVWRRSRPSNATAARCSSSNSATRRRRSALLGGGATQFTINTGAPPDWPCIRWTSGFFVGDEWRVRPNFTLNLGLRYETQTNIHDYRDFAPRVAFAWAPGGGGAEARQDRAARRLRHLLRPLRARQHACRAALTTASCSSSTSSPIPISIPTCRPPAALARLPIHPGDPGSQLRICARPTSCNRPSPSSGSCRATPPWR